MAPIRNLLATLLLAGTSLGRNLPQDSELVKRDAVDNCKTVLIALKASSFCSSFVPITDITVTTTTTALTTTTTTTITLPDCTTTVGTNTITNTATSTHTDTATVTVTSLGNPPNRKRGLATQSPTRPTTTTAAVKVTKTTASTTASPATCTIKGLPIQLNLFACDTIKSACLSFVKPNTKTVTSTVTPTATASVSTQPPCIPVTASTTVSVTTVETTTTTSTATVYQPTPSCNGNLVTSNTGTKFCQFFSGCQVRNSFSFYTSQAYSLSTTSDTDAIQRCANFVSASGSGVAQTFQVFQVPSEGTWHCDTSLTSNCDSNFQPNTYVNNIYQYNVVGSVCDS